MKKLLRVVLLSLSLSSIAYADSKSDAEALFEEGLKLFDAKDFKQACEKFAASQKLDPAAGTLLNLGRCYEAAGRPASAKKAYGEAATQAKADKDEPREKVAKQKEAALRPPQLIVDSKNKDVKLERDGESIPLGASDVDPGPHELVASAPGMKPWTTTITINAGDRKKVDVPVLEAEAASAGVTVTPPAAGGMFDDVPKNTQKTIALAVAGAGVVSLGIGAYFGLRAGSLKHDSDVHCSDATNICDARGVELIDSSGTAADVSTVLVLLGVALVGGGAALFFTAPQQTPKRVGFAF